MFLYRKQIFVILPFHFSWLNWVWKCCSISANFCIVYSSFTFRPSVPAYCQLYQFNSLTFHLFWQFHSMESNRSSSSINSYTFSSIVDIIDCYHSQRCQLTQPNLSEKSGKIKKLANIFHDCQSWQLQQFSPLIPPIFYRTRVRSLGMLVTK